MRYEKNSLKTEHLEKEIAEYTTRVHTVVPNVAADAYDGRR